MAGLVPATHALRRRREEAVGAPTCVGMTQRMPCGHLGCLVQSRMAAFVYMMTNRRNGVLYTGVTTNMPRRAYEHREGLIDGFTKRYGLKVLVYYETFDDVRDAIQREKNIKHWPRAWKVRFIHGFNPEWADLYESLF